MCKVNLLLAFVLLVLLDLNTSMTLPDMVSNTNTVDGPVDPGDAIRLSALGDGIEMVNVSDIQEFRERTNANVSHSLSNTSLADLESDNLTQLLLVKYRERKRQERLMAIQTQILQGLRMNKQPNMTGSVISDDERRRLDVIARRVHHFNSNNNGDVSDGLTANALHTTIQKLQSFYPSCSLPNNTDKQTWDNPQAFRIFYELPVSRPSFGVQVTVLLAKLRLYKKAFGDGWDFDLNEMQRYNMLDAMMDGSTSAINVSVYQYTKPVRHNKKEKKRLVDTRTVILDYEGWVEFNVISSLNNWFHNSHRNYGFVVEVEDVLGNSLDTNLFFRNMNCSSLENVMQDPPFPNIMELHPEMMGENDSALFDNETYPTLDLQTADISTIPVANFRLLHSSPFFNNAPNNKRLMRKRHLHLHRQSISKQATAHCVAETTYYTFEELDLGDTVLFPKGFQWTSCEGSCRTPPLEYESTRPLERPSTGRQLFHRLSKLWDLLLKYTIKVPQCFETGKRSLHIIFLNETNGVEEITFENFIPTECSCGES